MPAGDIHCEHVAPEATSAPETAADLTLPTKTQHRCCNCGLACASRNALFKHLRDVCEKSLAETDPKRKLQERIVLCIGYLGSKYFGSGGNHEREEATKPTVEGAVLAAARRAWGDVVLSITRSTRTEKGCHATENVLAVSVRASSSNCSGPALQRELDAAGAEIWLLAPAGPTSQPAFFDRMFSTKRRVYTCFIPYDVLMNASERHLRINKAPGYHKFPGDGLWMCSLEPTVLPADIAALVEEAIAGSGVKVDASDVRIDAGGHAFVDLPAKVVALAANGLNRKTWNGLQICAIAQHEANIKIDISKRLCLAMKALRGPPKKLRSFHSFISESISVLPNEAAAMRMLTKCIARGLCFDVSGPNPSGGDGTWLDSEWATISFAAPAYGPQQVRRMAGAVVAVVRGSVDEDYIDRCFVEQLPTLPAPSEALSLDSVVFGQHICNWRELAKVDHEKVEEVRRSVEGRICAEARQPWIEFVARLDQGALRAHLDKELAAASVAGDVARLVEVLKGGADVDAPDEYGRTPAYLAAEAGQEKSLKVLAEFRADLDRPANGGTTPILAAAVAGKLSMVSVLELCGADPARKSFAGRAVADYLSLQPHLLVQGDTEKAAMERTKTTVVCSADEDYAGAGTVYVDNYFTEDFLQRLEALNESLPMAAKEKASPTDRAYFADAEGWVTQQLNAAIAASGLEVVSETLPLMRFLIYPRPGGYLPPHVDLSRTHHGRKSTHTFLLYLSDCSEGGETLMLEALTGDHELAAFGGVAPGERTTVARVAPRRGRLLLFPHHCPHAAAPVVDAPKLLLRGEALPPVRESESPPA
eukprot:TRINITY_DN39466_c0_g1_i2.p1 TRINITY_DN39466_c0_g1~~TRINITY_DN39466_c0_g1_i2.p1  ORF type:complete len:827 (-),score=155.07 TRINITY_DN39466_c0_g1_i2:84-2540(-)